MAKEIATRNDRKLKHLFDGGSWNVYESNIINLGVGAPGTDLLENCTTIFKKATAHRMRFEKDHNLSMLFQYGPTVGIYEVRKAIADYFSKMFCEEVKSEDLLITSGATQGLHFIISTLVDLNGFVFVDEVTYMIALDAIKHITTLNIIPVKLNQDGPDIEDLERKLQSKKFKSKDKLFWAMYYTIPVYHNPTGILFSSAICEKLIELARYYDLLITCDDVYNILHYDDKTPVPRRLFAYDKRTDSNFQGNIISNCSFSKIISPGVRLGYLEAPPRIMHILESSGIAHSGGCFNNYTSGILASLFELNLVQDHIQKMFLAYKERMLATIDVLKRNLPTDCKLWPTMGGYFLWIELPEECNAPDFLEFCLQTQKISFIAGRRFTVDGEGSKNALRLSIAFHNAEVLKDATKRLCEAIGNYSSRVKN